MKNYFFLTLVLFLFFISCRNSQSQKEKQIKSLQVSAIQYLLGIPFADNGDSAAKLFYINPALKVGSTLNLDLVAEANSSHVTSGKKKLILVHGWDYNDRDSKTLSLGEQKARVITDGWADFIRSSTFDLIVLSKSYDIYAFDYLTSNPIDTNAKRFRSKMDSLFQAESNTVVILAHSMGGLVSRFAIYEGTSRPSYINRVITTGTPYHGSPWASPQFQGDRGPLGSIAGFLTDTDGGRDLAWDNFDGRISGAANVKLTQINAKKDRDDLFYAYYGSVNSTGNIGSGGNLPGLFIACPLLGSSFAPSDCIVPASSASLSGNTLSQVRDIGAYDHFDVKLLINSMQVTFYNDLP